MDVASIYRQKLTTPELAVAAIGSGETFSMGMAVSEPPALLTALADRAALVLARAVLARAVRVAPAAVSAAGAEVAAEGEAAVAAASRIRAVRITVSTPTSGTGGATALPIRDR